MKRLLNIDFMGCTHTWLHAKKPDIRAPFLSTIREIIRKTKPDKVFILQEGGSKYREGIYPDYKKQRKLRRESQTVAEKKDYEKFKNQADQLADILELLGCTKVQMFGAEADDLAGYLCSTLPSEEYQVLNLTEDSDWLQMLARLNTVQASYKACLANIDELHPTLWLNYGRYTEKHGITPDQLFEKKMLTGDTADSIPGIAGLGDKGAENLLLKYENIAGILANVDNLDIPRLTSKAKENLKYSERVLDQAFKLMNLRWSPEQWEDILKLNEKGRKEYLQSKIESINAPPVIDSHKFNELCYENGWIDFTDSQWQETFYLLK